MFGAVIQTIFQIHTPDLGGQATTQDVIQAVIDEIKPRTLAW